MYFILASSAVYLLANARVKENQSMFAKVIVKVKVASIFRRTLCSSGCGDADVRCLVMQQNERAKLKRRFCKMTRGALISSSAVTLLVGRQERPVITCCNNPKASFYLGDPI